MNVLVSDLVKEYYPKGFKSDEITAAIGKDYGIWRRYIMKVIFTYS